MSTLPLYQKNLISQEEIADSRKKVASSIIKSDFQNNNIIIKFVILPVQSDRILQVEAALQKRAWKLDIWKHTKMQRRCNMRRLQFCRNFRINEKASSFKSAQTCTERGKSSQKGECKHNSAYSKAWQRYHNIYALEEPILLHRNKIVLIDVVRLSLKLEQAR